MRVYCNKTTEASITRFLLQKVANVLTFSVVSFDVVSLPPTSIRHIYREWFYYSVVSLTTKFDGGPLDWG